jgi:hypothetical protein
MDAIDEYYPELDLSTVERNIYYMNGNDGTDFDWECNNRTCEFMVFYDTPSQMGLLKVSLYSDGTLSGYLWKDEGRGKAITLPDREFTDEPDQYADYLQAEYDDEDRYDEVVTTF